MKNYVDLILPSESADNYYMTKQKDQVDGFIYLDPEWYKKLLDPNTFYILGTKGSGKTLYAAYMCAGVRNNTISRSHTIDVSDYGKLIAMKVSNHLDFTDYLTMWKVILLQKFLLGIQAKEISFWGRDKNFQDIKDTISEYFGCNVSEDVFNPTIVIDSCGKQTEVTNYLRSQLTSGITVQGMTQSGLVEGSDQEKTQDSTSVRKEHTTMTYTDTWLRSINAFIETIEKITFKNNHYLFIDGLDVRPKDIDSKEYSECIGALVRAVYDINTKILGNLERKDKYDFKIIALTRTDIFLNSYLVNVTSCISDNCVELDWTYSNEKEFKYSNLYRMMNRVLGWDGESAAKPVEHYFSFKINTISSRPVSAAMFIQRQSRLRPRDVVVLLRKIQDECRRRKCNNPNSEIFMAQTFESSYSNYYTDQIKSEMVFQYSFDEIKEIFSILKMMRADSFTEEEFCTAYKKYIEHNTDFVRLFSSYRAVLDKLYSIDLIGWRESYEGKPKIHWHYREVKAIDESYCLPWEQMECANDVRILIHRGASKNILGTIKYHP